MYLNTRLNLCIYIHIVRLLRSEINPKLSSSEEALLFVSSSVSSTKFARVEARATLFFFSRLVKQSEVRAATFERFVKRSKAEHFFCV